MSFPGVHSMDADQGPGLPPGAVPGLRAPEYPTASPMGHPGSPALSLPHTKLPSPQPHAHLGKWRSENEVGGTSDPHVSLRMWGRKKAAAAAAASMCSPLTGQPAHPPGSAPLAGCWMSSTGSAESGRVAAAPTLCSLDSGQGVVQSPALPPLPPQELPQSPWRGSLQALHGLAVTGAHL